MNTKTHQLLRRVPYYSYLVKEAVNRSGLYGRILDAGCGPGSSTTMLAAALPDSAIIGIDNNSEFIDTALNSRSDCVDYVVGDCYTLPFQDNSFDGCFALNFFEVLRDPLFALLEMRRIVKPDGKICAVDIDYRNIFLSHEIAHIKKLQRINAIIKRKEGFNPHIGSQLYSLFETANLQIEDVSRIRIDNTIVDGFEDTLLYVDAASERSYLVESNLFSATELDEMYAQYQQVKLLPDFIYAIEYDCVGSSVPYAR